MQLGLALLTIHRLVPLYQFVLDLTLYQNCCAGQRVPAGCADVIADVLDGAGHGNQNPMGCCYSRASAIDWVVVAAVLLNSAGAVTNTDGGMDAIKHQLKVH